jgi:hypothetical protein
MTALEWKISLVEMFTRRYTFMPLCGSGLCKDIEEIFSFIEASSDIHCT